MKLKYLAFTLLFAVIFGLFSCGQTKKGSSQTQTDLIDSKVLNGKWRSESDGDYIVVFDRERFIEIYKTDTTDILNYKLAASCNMNDNTSRVNLQKAFILFYTANDSLQQCNEILNIKSDILSWLNNENGKIFVFKKVNK